MRFRQRNAHVGHRISLNRSPDYDVVILAGMEYETVEIRSRGGAKATICPGKGFNCIGLEFRVAGEQIQVLHAESDVLGDGSPTRSGMPVLFPFPNRIAGANFDWDGDTYEIPVTHPGDTNAIHGLVCRAAWTDWERTISEDAVTGRFRLSSDASDGVLHWPGDLELRLTYTITDDALTISSEVVNPEEKPVPFGMGFHPYFAPLGAGTGPEAVAACHVQCDATAYWVLEDSIPTGEKRPVAGKRDLRRNPSVGDRELDDILTDLPAFVGGRSGLMPRATLTGGAVTLSLNCDESWRDVVVFTPPNRESIAIEPYTCPTDAVHLTEQGENVGWQVLGPGGSWVGTVQLRVSA
ncbi:MAG: aldose 1-epimerase [Actinomycetia bacterium]|nr:aldose 1-epimerase [Actinomycetes bacterium]